MSLADYQALVDDLVRDKDGVIDAPRRDKAIALAVSRYSLDRPRSVVADVVAPGGRRTATPAAWSVGFSALSAVEYPVGRVPASQLKIGETRLYESPTEVLIELPIDIPAGTSVRYTYSVQHTLGGGTDTIPLVHQISVAAFAASVLCEQLANYYATESAPTIAADTVDHADKSRKFASRAKAYREQYLTSLGVDATRIAPASAVVDLDLGASDGGGRLFHARRYSQ